MSQKDLYMPADAGFFNRVLDGLYDERVSAKVSDIWMPQKDEAVFVAQYILDDGKLAVISLIEFNIAAGLAALLTRHPPSMAEEMIEAKEFTPEMLDNLKEAMNIFASLFNKDTFFHVLFKDFKLVAFDKLDAKHKKALESSDLRLDYKLTTQGGYGQGMISFYKVPR